jgi:excisionase family DNA binding protein
MKRLLSTKEAAQFLGVNEKMVYTLVSEKGLPATKITGKWLFPIHLLEQWVETHTINYPDARSKLPPYEGLLVIAGSNDLLLDNTIQLFNTRYREHLAVFGNLGSMGGLRALRQGLCHVASSHLLQENGEEYNFEFAHQEFDRAPVVVNFCRREQGLMVAKGNPKQIRSVGDLGQPGIRVVNRPLGTGTRLLFDMKLKEAGIAAGKINGYDREFGRHMDVGIEVLAGRADAGPGIRPVAALLGLDFLPIRWERYDLLIAKERFFEKGVQFFLGLLHDPAFLDSARQLAGYDVSLSGRMVFPGDAAETPASAGAGKSAQ